jgi:hypothetical protein
MHKRFWPKKLKERDHSEDVSVDGKMDLRETGWEGVD